MTRLDAGVHRRAERAGRGFTCRPRRAERGYAFLALAVASLAACGGAAQRHPRPAASPASSGVASQRRRRGRKRQSRLPPEMKAFPASMAAAAGEPRRRAPRPRRAPHRPPGAGSRKADEAEQGRPRRPGIARISRRPSATSLRATARRRAAPSGRWSTRSRSSARRVNRPRTRRSLLEREKDRLVSARKRVRGTCGSCPGGPSVDADAPISSVRESDHAAFAQRRTVYLRRRVRAVLHRHQRPSHPTIYATGGAWTLAQRVKKWRHRALRARPRSSLLVPLPPRRP